MGQRPKLRDDLRSSYASVRFTLIYLVAQVLRESDQGRELLDAPEGWLPGTESEVKASLDIIARDVIDSVNFHVREEERDRGSEFDPKVVFKSKAGVERLEHDVLRLSRRQAQRDDEYLFKLEPTMKSPEES